MTGTQPEPAAQLLMQTANGVARAAALSVTVNTEVEPVGIVAYQSAGRLLVVGSVDAIASATAALAGHANISCTGLASESAEILLSGYLGHFELQAGAGTPQVYDLVLDLGSPHLLQTECLPPGYFAPGDDSVALQAVLAEIPGLTGEF